MEPNQEQGLERATSRLVDAVRQVKISAAEKSDVVVEMREAERSRLELLVQELAAVIEDVPVDDERFDFAISAGLKPRFWVDVTAHVAMGTDRRTYRFVRDTRLGRILLGESTDKALIANRVTAYVAERMHERELMLAGETYSARDFLSEDVVDTLEHERAERSRVRDVSAKRYAERPEYSGAANEDMPLEQRPSATRSALGGMMWVLLGLAIGAAGLAWFFRGALV